MRALSLPVALTAAFALVACSDGFNMIKGEKGERGETGEKGEPGPAGLPGPSGPAGTAIRMIDGECSTSCTVACEATERILSTYAINPGGTFIFEDVNRATFRPQRQGVSVKVTVACIPK